MSQRVQVIVRLRPGNETEKRAAGSICVSQEGPVITIHGDRARQHTFDDAFGIDADQSDVFNAVGEPAVARIMEGYNSTLLAYGQTGSGKTHTMLGPGGGTPEALDSESSMFAQRGLIPRMIEALFDRLAGLDKNEFSWTVGTTVFELYKEQLYDSLAEHPRDPSDYRIREDIASGRGVYVENLFEKSCQSAHEVLQALKVGASRRRVASTQANDTSSRSHSITLISVKLVNHLLNGTVTHSRLTLVDLAGSEKVSKTQAGGDRLKEAQSINLSLTLLGNVIYRLTDGKSSYIPYRDSKLTRILQDSLGGNSCTTLLCCASPSSYNKEETIGTLAFAARAKEIRNKPRINRDFSESELRAALTKALEEIADLNERLNLQSELMLRSGDKSPQKSLAERAVAAEGDSNDNQLQLTIARLLEEVADLRKQVSDLQERLTLSESQVEFHRARATQADDRVFDLTSKLKREETLFERRICELVSAAEVTRTDVNPTVEPRLRDMTRNKDTHAKKGMPKAPLTRQPVDAGFLRAVGTSNGAVAIQPLPVPSTAPVPEVATDTQLLLEIERLKSERDSLRQDVLKRKEQEEQLHAKLHVAESKCEETAKIRDQALQNQESLRLKLADCEQLNAEMKRILDALNIDVEEQLAIERQRTAAAASEAVALRGKNHELVAVQAQQEFCDIAMVELVFKNEDMDAIENEIVTIRFARLPTEQISSLKQSCSSTLMQLDSFLSALLDRIADRTFSTANLETCRLNIISDAALLQGRVAAGLRRLQS